MIERASRRPQYLVFTIGPAAPPVKRHIPSVSMARMQWRVPIAECYSWPVYKAPREIPGFAGLARVAYPVPAECDQLPSLSLARNGVSMVQEKAQCPGVVVNAEYPEGRPCNGAVRKGDSACWRHLPEETRARRIKARQKDPLQDVADDLDASTKDILEAKGYAGALTANDFALAGETLSAVMEADDRLRAVLEDLQRFAAGPG